MSNLDRLHSLADAFFQRVHDAHEKHMACRAGCASCCTLSTVLPVELDKLRPAVLALPEDARERLAARAASPEPRCPLLEDDRCTVYEARPAICRTHGLPIRVNDPEPRRDACPLNFADSLPLDAVPETDVLDLDRLNAMLVLSNRLAMEGADHSTERRSLRAELSTWLRNQAPEAGA